MSYSQFHLKRLRVMQSGEPVYDQSFHLGVNIIRGENGSGKSTIADFIFYAFGGEFENWKSVAANCDEVQAEIGTAGGVITIKRRIDKAQTPISVFFGPLAAAAEQGLDGWQTYPIRRQTNQESFSQVLFRASGIPEAQSQGAANITMNQLMRLLYSDQRTPASFLFRYESFDTREIREAVGDLICGIRGYEAYEIELSLRELNKKFDEHMAVYTSLLRLLPDGGALTSVASIDHRMLQYDDEYKRISLEIENSSDLVSDSAMQAFAEARRKSAADVRKVKAQITETEQLVHTSDFEITDLSSFIEHLEELAEKLPKAEKSSDVIGSIEFSLCPSCLSPLDPTSLPDHCILCGRVTDPEIERSRYLQIKLDLDIQIRESRQLLAQRVSDAEQANKKLRVLKSEFQARLSDYSVKYDLSTSPRESFSAERYQRLGQIDREKIELARLRERVSELESVSAKKAQLGAEIEALKDRQKALDAASNRRRKIALTSISEIAKGFLRSDLDRQDEFKSASSVEVNFRDNSVLVDGELNFAESSNVIVKNSAILALLVAAIEDLEFLHPRFLLMDNVEDKGMEQARSHNFQRIIVEASKQAKVQHQIIFTTSMIDPSLETDEYVIGPYYTHSLRSLHRS